MDDALPLRLREVNLGHGGHPLEGARDVQKLHAVSGVRQAQLANDLSENVRQLSGSHKQYGSAKAVGGINRMHQEATAEVRP
jgi:hypothetical protein